MSLKPSDLQRLFTRLEHDVRNPIGNVLGYVDLLREAHTLSIDQLQLLEGIKRNCELVLQVMERFAEATEHLTRSE